MRIVIDALGAPALTGGMYLHALETIRAWGDEHPEDELTVVGDAWVDATFGRRARVRTVTWRSAGVVARVIGQLFVTPLIAARAGADAVVSLSPVLSPLLRGETVCYVHDWRHLRVPEEFSGVRSWYRRLWVQSARRASLVACISRKTLEETAEFCSRVDGLVLVENGRDHPRRWPVDRRPGSASTVVTFGHHNNKRPDLVMRAFAQVPESDRAGIRLVVLGTGGTQSEALRALAAELGVSAATDVVGFVDDSTYEATIATARVVVLASSDEGFGLPVAEAQCFGIPVVSASDGGLAQIHDGLFDAAPEPAAMSEAIKAALERGCDPDAGQAVHTWRNAVGVLRCRLEGRATTVVDRSA